MLSRLPLTGAGLRRLALPLRNVARARLYLWGCGGRRRMRAAHGAVGFRARFAASSGGFGGDAASPGGAMRLRPIERAVAGCRSDRTLPPEIAPLAGRRGAAVLLLHRLDAIRHAAAVRGIVPPCDRPVDDPWAIHDDAVDMDDGDAAPVPVRNCRKIPGPP